jgi:hypothetical protein
MEVDLCFVMDCTSSMEDYIEGGKDCIVKVAECVGGMEPAVRIRVGFCGYRDHCDGSDRLQIFDFTNSCNEFRNYIAANVEAEGGGDTPEDVLGGLDAAINRMTWRNNTRVLFHICDAPPHGRRFYTTMDDDYPNGDPNGLTVKGVLGNMRSANIHYFFGKIDYFTDKMVDVFHSIIGDFKVFDLNTVRDNPNALVDTLVDRFVDATVAAISTAISLT